MTVKEYRDNLIKEMFNEELYFVIDDEKSIFVGRKIELINNSNGAKYLIAHIRRNYSSIKDSEELTEQTTRTTKLFVKHLQGSLEHEINVLLRRNFLKEEHP